MMNSALAQVIFCGENPEKRLVRPEDVDAEIAFASYWRCSYSPYGSGQLLALHIEANALENGADAKVTNRLGQTALELAEKGGYSEIAKCVSGITFNVKPCVAAIAATSLVFKSPTSRRRFDKSIKKSLCVSNNARVSKANSLSNASIDLSVTLTFIAADGFKL